MNWLQLEFTVPQQLATRLANLLNDVGAAAVTLQDGADAPVLEPDPGEVRLWSDTRVVGLFDPETDPDAVVALVNRRMQPRTPLSCTTTTLGDKDWVKASLDQFQPLRFGQRLWICPSWQPPPDPGAVNVLLNPGLAFGTGTHPTTALCLEWLDNQSVEGKTVLDFGCGSGILAIAAARLGAAPVLVADHDPQAIEATFANAELNGVADRLELRELGNLGPGCCDVLLANILANPLVQLAPNFAHFVRPGGQLVLSGILDDQTASVTAAYTPWFTITATTERDSWIRVTAVRHGA